MGGRWFLSTVNFVWRLIWIPITHFLKNEGFGMNQDCTVGEMHCPVEIQQEIMDCYLNFIWSPSLHHFLFPSDKRESGRWSQVLKKCNNSKTVIYFRSSKRWRFVVHINTVKALRSPVGLAHVSSIYLSIFYATY